MSTSSPARPGLEAFERSVRLPVHQLVTELRDLLGAKLVAYLASIGGLRKGNLGGAGRAEHPRTNDRHLSWGPIARRLGQPSRPSRAAGYSWPDNTAARALPCFIRIFESWGRL